MWEGDREVALTTMRRGVTRQSPEMKEFVRRHRHERKEAGEDR